MKIDEFLLHLFPSQADPWLRLLKLTQVIEALNKDLPGKEFVQYFNDQLQMAWLRPQGKERWEVHKRFSASEELSLTEIFFELNLFNEIDPRKSHYDCVLLMGSVYEEFMLRVDLLKSLGVTYDRLYSMSAFRHLDPRLESEIIAKLGRDSLPTNEIEMMQYLVREEFDHPDIFDVIAHPAGHHHRATTADVLQEWHKTFFGKSQDHEILVISTQPYTFYQHATAVDIFSDHYHLPVEAPKNMTNIGTIKESYTVETVGVHSKPEMMPELVLDALARYVYSSRGLFSRSILE